MRTKLAPQPVATPPPADVQQIAEAIDNAELPASNPDAEHDDCIGGGCHGIGGPSRAGREEIIEINQDMRHPAPACHPAQPVMPERARLMGITGRVVVRYVVHADGGVSDVRSLLPETPAVLGEAVEHWLLECRHRPAMVDGRPVSVHVTQMFTFHIQ
jgi:TonB family protein